MRSLTSVPSPCIAAPKAPLQSATEDGLFPRGPRGERVRQTLGALTIVFKKVVLQACRTKAQARARQASCAAWLCTATVAASSLRWAAASGAPPAWHFGHARRGKQPPDVPTTSASP